MAQRIIITAGTGAITGGNQVAFSLHSKHFRGGQKPVISVKGLAGVETVSFWKLVNGSWVEVADSAGTQVSYTASYETDVFNGPGTYGITKSATASSIVLTLDDGL